MRRIFRFGFLIYIARQLPPEQIGVFAVLITITELLAVLSGTGLMDLITREVARQPEAVRSLVSKYCRLRFLYLLLLVPLALLAVRFTGMREHLLPAAILCLSLFPRAASESFQGALRGLHRSREFFYLELVQGVCLMATALVLVPLRPGITVAVTAEAVSWIAGGIGGAWLLRGHRSQAGAKTDYRGLFRKTFAFNLYPLVVSVYDRIDVILISRLVGDFAAGIYSIPYRCLATLQIVPYGVLTAYLPDLSVSDWSETSLSRVRRVFGMLYFFSLTIVATAIPLAPAFFSFVFGDAYLSSAGLLRVLVWASVPMFANFMLNVVLLARNRELVFLRTALVCTLVNVALNLLLIPRYGAMAAAVVTIVTELALLAQNAALIKKEFGFFLFPQAALTTSLWFGVVLLLVSAVGGASPYLAALMVFLLATVYFWWRFMRERDWVAA